MKAPVDPAKKAATQGELAEHEKAYKAVLARIAGVPLAAAKSVLKHAHIGQK